MVEKNKHVKRWTDMTTLFFAISKQRSQHGLEMLEIEGEWWAVPSNTERCLSNADAKKAAYLAK